MKKAAILTIGDELLIGSIVDTNAAHLGQCLTELGIEPVWTLTVGDDAARIRHALDLCVSLADIVLITGGLGPTHDDVTKTVLAEATGDRLVFHPYLLDQIEEMFVRRGLAMPESNRIQAFMPERAVVLDNPVGTAPGFMLRHGEADVFVMPGVPREMKKMMAEQVAPRLQGHAGGRVILHRVLKTAGIGESSLFETIKDLIESAKDVRVASLPQEAGINLRLTVSAATGEEARQRIAVLETALRSRAGSFIYGTDGETMEQTLGRLLTDAEVTVALAESCTGGLVCDRLTDTPGSSAYVERGVVAYSNETKKQLLGVSDETLRAFGAVSAQTAAAMAEGVRRISGTTFGLSTTGIAGPSGATPEKPVGLVYIALAHPEGVIVRELRLGTERRINKVRAATAAMNLLRLYLVDPAHIEKGI